MTGISAAGIGDEQQPFGEYVPRPHPVMEPGDEYVHPAAQMRVRVQIGAADDRGAARLPVAAAE